MRGRPVVENIKERQAAELLQIFKKAFGQPEGDAIKSLYGLLTGHEIEEMLKRDAVRNEITESLAEKGRFSVKAVAEKCDCSSELVGRVWEAICKEYPPQDATPATARIAIVKEDRAQGMVKEILAENGFRIDIRNNRAKTGVVIDMREKIAPIPCQLIAGQDIFDYMKAGAVQSAFVGYDKIYEKMASVTSSSRKGAVNDAIRDQFRLDAQFTGNPFRMSLAIPKEKAAVAEPQGLGYLNDKVIITSYPATLAQHLKENGIKAKEIKTVKGGVEQARAVLGGDVILDVVQSGKSLKENGLVPFGDPIYPGNISLISLAGARRTGVLADFANRLG